ncbi:MAG TPA: ATP-binding protein [Phycisphaerae bacterium]
MQQIEIVVTDASQIGEARRAAIAMAARANLDETKSGRVAIIMSELASNLVRYGQKGKVLVRGEAQPDGSGSVQILAIDSGPGMDFGRCAADGYSTGGTPGNGLGAVQRLADVFDIYSQQPSGSVIMATVQTSQKPQISSDNFRWACISLPAPGEQLCGDTFGYRREGSKASFMVADGLGHGPDAAKASTCATVVFDNDPFVEGASFIQLAHGAMGGTRGAALAIASVDTAAATLRYAGVGNIAATLYTGLNRKGLPSLNGIVGSILPRLRVFDYELSGSGMIVMHSDGLQTRWSMDPYPGLALRHPAVIAGVLFRDFSRGRDDVTVLIGSWQGGLS